MGATTMKTFEARSLTQWRAWLARHHDSETEVWLVFDKVHTGRPCIDYKDALDEALCFGWVDSLIKRLDEHRYARKFTPRKPDSKWSAVNRARYAALKAGGRLHAAGVARAPTTRTYDPRPPTPTSIPGYIAKALKQRATAWRTFESLAPSERRRIYVWIDIAKQDETKQRRLQEAIRVLASGRKLGLK